MALAVGLPLLALDAIGRLDLAVYAAFGGLAMLYGHGEPREAPVQSQIVAGAGLVVAMAVAMAYSAAHAPCSCWAPARRHRDRRGHARRRHAWEPRGEMFFVLVLLIIANVPTSWDRLPLGIAVGAAGAAFSVLLAALNFFRAARG